MEPFTQVTAPAVAFDQESIDTDQIIPARFLKYPREQGYGRFLFHDQCFDGDGAERPEFPLNRPAGRAARIIVAAANFGCGSSREGAVFALADRGIRALIAPSFGDIFFKNCFKNGLLPIRLPAADAARLRALVHARPGAPMTVDLVGCTITDPEGGRLALPVATFWRDALLKGLDEIGMSLSYGDRIAAFEARYYAAMDWLARGGRP
jgi:3-isopropylmalate/(R)-2-methylmalate dehydratase small subunit